MATVAETVAATRDRLRARDFAGAALLCQQALAADPAHAEAHYLLGEACHAAGKPQEAIAALSRAIELQPNHAMAHNTLGAVWGGLGKFNEAAASFRRATEAKPDYVEAFYNLAALAAHENRLDEAAAGWERAVELRPDLVDAISNLAVVYSKQARLEEAAASFRRVLALRPDSIDATASLGTLLTRQGRIDEAREVYQQALVRHPEQDVWRLNILSLCPLVFQTGEEIDRYRQELLAGLDRFSQTPLGPDFPARATAGTPPSFHLQFQGRDERPLREAYAKLFRECFVAETPTGATGRPRIGFVVTDGHEMLFAKSLGGVLDRLDTELFDVAVICSRRGAEFLRAALRNPAVRLVAVVNKLEAFAAAIRPLELDLLYYWEVATDSVNYFLPFLRLAPTQCTSWGIQVTSGIPRLEHYLSSALVEPDDAQRHYSERLVLADTLLSFQERAMAPDPPKPREAFNLSANQHVYLCAQQLGKFHPDFDPILAGILRQDALAVVVTTEDRYGPFIGEQLRRRFARTMPDVAERVVFLPFQGPADYLSLVAAADVLLDPLHFGGVNSSYDGFSLDKPIVTLPSGFQRGRYTLGCYRKMGITECVARDAAHYVEIAVALGTDAAFRSAVVEKIRRESPLLFNDGQAVLEHERIFATLVAQTRETSQRPAAEAYQCLAITLQKQNRLAEAEAAAQRAAELNPRSAEIQHQLGAIQSRRGQSQAALESYARAVALRPESAEMHNHLGAELWKLRRLDEAAGEFARALELKPDYAGAHNNLGNLLGDRGQILDAIDAYRRALQCDPLHATAHCNLANALLKCGQADEALAEFERAIALAPENADVIANYGACLQSQGRLDEAIAAYRAAIQKNPQQVAYHGNLLYALNFHPGYDAPSVFAEHRRWAQRHADPLLAASAPHANDRKATRRLRVGYVSAHFRDHAVNFFSEPILAAHDHRAVEVFCYSAALAGECDATTRRLQGYADQWRDISTLSNEQASQMIRADAIDVLVDLSGHIAGNRLLVFARKPAPVQVTYLGYQNTTGMQAMDYRLTDAWSDPPGVTDRWYTEKLVRLPRAFFCYLRSANAPPLTPLPALASGAITFGSFNQLAKVTPRVLATWADILRAVPGSRLQLLAPLTDKLGESLRQTFEQHGISAERLELVGRRPRGEYLKLINRVDIALDPFPFNGHTTTCDCLWQGVPVVTLAGDSYASRFGGSALVNLGLHDLIAASREQYIEIARGLAADVQRLGELRADLRGMMERSPLLDARGFTRNLEAAYRQMWADWCASRKS